MRGPSAPLKGEGGEVGSEGAGQVGSKLCEGWCVVDRHVACCCACEFPVEVYRFASVESVFFEEFLGVCEAVVALSLSGSLLVVHA